MYAPRHKITQKSKDNCIFIDCPSKQDFQLYSPAVTKKLQWSPA